MYRLCSVAMAESIKGLAARLYAIAPRMKSLNSLLDPPERSVRPTQW